MGSETLYRVMAAPVGTHYSAEGPLEITADRVRNWIDKFNELSAEGIQFPTPWGHQLRAIPVEDEEARKFAMSRYNAGYIRGMEQNDNGDLVIVGTAPPGYEIDPETKHLINRQDNTRIGEVSIAIGDWTDGQGRHHPDIVVHSALVPMPVVAGQGGFLPFAEDYVTPSDLSGGDAPSVQLAHALGSSGGVVIRHQLATKLTTDDGDADDYTVDANEGDDMDNNLFSDRIQPEMPTGDANEQVARVVGLLQAVGIRLSAGTTGANMMERLESALSVLHDQGFRMSAGSPADQKQAIDYSVPGDATIDPAKGSSVGGMQMMSTQTGRHVELNGMAKKLAENAGVKAQANLAKRWQELETMGVVSGEVAARESAAVFTAMLSFDTSSGAVTIPIAESRLALAEELTSAKTHFENMLSTGVTVKNPARKQKPDENDQNAELERIASIAYGRPVKIMA